MSSKPLGFSRPCRGGENAKSRRIPAAFPWIFGDWSTARLEPAGVPIAVAVHMIPVAAAVPIAAHHAMLEAAMMPTTAEPAFHMGQDGKPALLAVVERLVERVGRIGDLLQRGRRGRHVVGAFAQARDRIVGLLLILVRLCVYRRIGAIDPHLGEIPPRGLHRK